MKRTLPGAGVLAVILSMASVVEFTQSPQAAMKFEDLYPTGVSIVVPDIEKTSVAWADLLGVAPPRIVEPEIVYPPVFDGNRAGRDKETSVPTMNVSVSFHQPPPGRNYWRDVLDAHGQALYRMNFRLPGNLAEQTAYFEKKGGTLVVGDPAKTSYVNVNLWSKYGVAVQIVTAPVTPPATQAAPATPRPMPPAGSFVGSPLFKIAFVVPDLEQAVKDYADLFGIPAASATRGSLPMVFPAGFTGDRTAKVKSATLHFPNGVRLELNEPQGGASIWRNHLQKHGRSIFSVGFRVTSVRDQAAYLTGKGGKLVLGGPDATYAYFDFAGPIGAVIEIHQ